MVILKLQDDSRYVQKRAFGLLCTTKVKSLRRLLARAASWISALAAATLLQAVPVDLTEPLTPRSSILSSTSLNIVAVSEVTSVHLGYSGRPALLAVSISRLSSPWQG